MANHELSILVESLTEVLPKEIPDYVYQPYGKLLDTAFSTLGNLVESTGITESFVEPWLLHSEQLFKFWQYKLVQYAQIVGKEGLFSFPEEPVSLNNAERMEAVIRGYINDAYDPPTAHMRYFHNQEIATTKIPLDQVQIYSLSPLIEIEYEQVEALPGSGKVVTDYYIQLVAGRIEAFDKMIKTQKNATVAFPGSSVEVGYSFNWSAFNKEYTSLQKGL